MRLVEDLHHLLQAGNVRIDDVVGQQHGERFVAHQFARHQDGVAQSECFLLANIGDVDHVGNLAHDVQQLGLLSLLEHLLEFVADVEVIFDGALAAAGHDDDLVAAGRQRLFHAVLDDRLVDEWQHLFGLSLGGGQKARAQSGGGKNCFANLLLHGASFDEANS